MNASGERQKSQITITLPNAGEAPPTGGRQDGEAGVSVNKSVQHQATGGSKQGQRGEEDRDESARRIQHCWWQWRDKQMFLLLKHSVRAAEMSLSYDILRKVSPQEADLLKDPAVQAKIRFRFAGTEFPPIVVFKIFLVKASNMFSGKNCIRPASDASKDSLKAMGQRQFINQIVKDACHYEKTKVWDIDEVVSIKDYWKLQAGLDELPCNMGGRDNHWRRLTLNEIPRHTVFYDLVDFIQNSGNATEHLRDHIPKLLTRPSTSAIEAEQANAISRIKIPPQTPMSPQRLAAAQAKLAAEKAKTSSRGSRQAKERAQNMRQLYMTGSASARDEGQEGMSHRHQHHHNTKQNTMISSLEDNWEQEAEKLYQWTQELTFEKTFDGL